MIVGLLVTSRLHGQSNAIVNFSVNEGLPSNEAYEIYQDKQGFIWIATDNGVARYDGYQLESFHTADGLTDPVVFGFFEDHRNRLWFRTYSGRVCYYDPRSRKIQPYPFNKELATICQTSFLSSLYIDAADNLWYGVRAQWGRIDSQGHINNREESRAVFAYIRSNGSPRPIQGMGNGSSPATKLIGIDNSMLVVDTAHYQPITFNNISAVQWKDKLYISIGHWIAEYAKGALTIVTHSPWSIISISVDRDNHLWTVGRGGARRFDNPDFKTAVDIPELSGLSVTSMLHDNDRNLWASTLEKGVFYIPQTHIKNFIVSEKGTLVTGATLGEQIFLGERSGKLYALNSSLQRVDSMNHPGGIFRINTHQHNLWVAGPMGTSIIDTSLHIVAKVNPELFGFYSHEADRVWHVHKNKLYAFGKDGSLTGVKNMTRFLREMIADDSAYYFSGRTGLYVYSKDLQLSQEVDSLGAYKISGLTNLTDSILLLTTKGDGILLLNKKNLRLTRYNTSNKFIAQYVYSALKTDSSIWLSTERGIIKTSIPSLIKGNPSYVVLTKKNGLLDDRATFLLEKNEQIIAGFPFGISVLDKRNAQHNRFPKFYFKDISFNNQSCAPGDNDIIVDFSKNNIVINFGFIDFSNQNIFIRYRLQSDDPWTYTSDRSLRFYALSPGDYTFEIAYSTDNTHWINSPETFSFTIKPPIWRTWYFLTATIILISLAIFLYFWRRAVAQKRFQQNLTMAELATIERERTRIAKDLHDGVGTDFTAIKMMVSQMLKKHQEPDVNHVEEQFQTTIQEIKTIIYGLSPPGLERYGLFAALKNYIEKIKQSSGHLQIEYDTYGEDIKDTLFNLTIFRIVQELISNSIKHSGATQITLHVNRFNDALNIVYEDNGHGFDPQQSLRGLGLSNIESRVNTLRGKLQFETGTFGVSYTIDIPMSSLTTT